MIKYVMLILLIGSIYAYTPEEAVYKYYEITAKENIDEYMNIMDLGDLTEEEIARTKLIATTVFSEYDTVRYSINNLKIIEDEDYALAKYTLSGETNGAERIDYELDYIMLLHRYKDEWKVVFVMPLQEYLDTESSVRKMEIINDMIDTITDQTKEEPVIYFNEEPMQPVEVESESSCTGTILFIFFSLSSIAFGQARF